MLRVARTAIARASSARVSSVRADSPRLISGRAGKEYKITDEQRTEFRERGYTILRGFLSEDELSPFDEVYARFMDREIHVPDRDFCDMSKSFDTAFENFSIVNCMLPRVYHPPLQGNLYEVLAESVAAQLYPDTEMRLDYDQLLNKRPGKEDAVFAMHQDMAYWPPRDVTPDTRTVTFSLALDTTTRANGCIAFVDGSGVKGELRPHVPIGKDRDDAHAIAVEVGKDEHMSFAEVKRGDVSIHDEWVVHGSGGNTTKGDRRTYVIAFRTADTVERERALGFNHSHNTEVNWDSWIDGWNADKEAELLKKIEENRQQQESV